MCILNADERAGRPTHRAALAPRRLSSGDRPLQQDSGCKEGLVGYASSSLIKNMSFSCLVQLQATSTPNEIRNFLSIITSSYYFN